jgi:hypothetical protein
LCNLGFRFSGMLIDIGEAILVWSRQSRADDRITVPWFRFDFIRMSDWTSDSCEGRRESEARRQGEGGRPDFIEEVGSSRPSVRAKRKSDEKDGGEGDSWLL